MVGPVEIRLQPGRQPANLYAVEPAGRGFTKATTMWVEVGAWQPQPVNLARCAQPLDWRAP
ncbi:MAG TPA: hypothetical protein VI776_12225 [Anaerolineales bacterium]|nr:hypothetical protein [Anaerolineales bacterium]